MSVKTTTFDQHMKLHETWPEDCCLCRTEKAIASLNADLTEVRGNLKSEVEFREKLESDIARLQSKLYDANLELERLHEERKDKLAQWNDYWQRQKAEMEAEIIRLKEAGEEDYEGMRSFQGRFIEADQDRRKLREGLLLLKADMDITMYGFRKRISKLLEVK